MVSRSKISKFNSWVGREYKKIYLEQKFTGTFEMKINPRIEVILIYSLPEIKAKTYNKTPNQIKAIVFEYFLSILKDIETSKKNYLIQDKKHSTEYTIKEKNRILEKNPKIKKTDCFYISNRWLILKREVKNMYKCGCMKCGSINCEIHVDHILPRSLYPELELNIHNLQILCKNCNEIKSNKQFNDYRTKEQKELCQKKYM
jgi:5-methylcytosine-specific restriction endonuclease McrA